MTLHLPSPQQISSARKTAELSVYSKQLSALNTQAVEDLPEGQRILITYIFVQAQTGTASKFTLKSSQTNPQEEFSVICTEMGSGISQIYDIDYPYYWPKGKGIVISLDKAIAHSVTIHYLVVSTRTGMPIGQ